MIPKKIHYCWFGGNPLPPLARKCIKSWKKYMPDYEIIEWNEDNFDVNMIPYTAEAYKAKKYAFVSDYARFWVLYKYGGVYFDTDVEVIKPMDDIIAQGDFMGFETDPDTTEGSIGMVAPGLGFGVKALHPTIKILIDYYNGISFESTHDMSKVKSVVEHTTDLFAKYGLKSVAGIQRVADINIYPAEYFAPINITSHKLHVTPNTHTIHRYMDSWGRHHESPLKTYMRKILPESVLFWYNKRRQQQS